MTMRWIGVLPCWPKAIMCSQMKAAPALVSRPSPRAAADRVLVSTRRRVREVMWFPLMVWCPEWEEVTSR